MPKSLFISLFLLFTISIYSQQLNSQATEIESHLNHQKEQISILKIDVTNCSLVKINNFIAEAETWEGKITLVTFDSQTMTISIEHNALWHPLEISEMLAKYDITKDKIISDK